jgi:threonine/homoserine/homoserine lactone efflux protein
MLEQLFVVVSVTSLVMVTPGPDMVLVLRNTLVEGRRAGLRTSMGIRRSPQRTSPERH